MWKVQHSIASLFRECCLWNRASVHLHFAYMENATPIDFRCCFVDVHVSLFLITFTKLNESLKFQFNYKYGIFDIQWAIVVNYNKQIDVCSQYYLRVKWIVYINYDTDTNNSTHIWNISHNSLRGIVKSYFIQKDLGHSFIAKIKYYTYKTNSMIMDKLM